MTNHNVMTSAEAQALLAVQQGPDALHCPAGHGVLRVWPDAGSPSGLSLTCTGCGHRVAAPSLLDPVTPSTSTVDAEPMPATRLPDGTEPRGLLPNGTVRTTGCVQFGRLPVSSGFWAAVTAFSVAAPLTAVAPALPVVAPPLGYLMWKLHTKRLPASQAVNVRRVRAAELTVGQQIRLYGTAGPVGVVSEVDADDDGRIRLRLAGGTEIRRHPEQRLWQVDLRN